MIRTNAIHVLLFQIAGYGFLSESAQFAQSLVDNSIGWVGPPPSVLELFGDKIQARALAEKSNVPVVRGSGNLTSGDEVMSILEEGKVGLPAIMKVGSLLHLKLACLTCHSNH